MTIRVVLNRRSLQMERELKIRRYGRETFCNRKALNRHASVPRCARVRAL